jgi:hypothetical protein
LDLPEERGSSELHRSLVLGGVGSWMFCVVTWFTENNNRRRVCGCSSRVGVNHGNSLYYADLFVSLLLSALICLDISIDALCL